MSVTTATSDFAPYIAAINAMKRARGVAILAHNDIEFVRPCNLCPRMRRIRLPGILLSLRRMATQVHVDTDVAGRARLAVELMLRVGRGVRR
jgi:quinolinate synthase